MEGTLRIGLAIGTHDPSLGGAEEWTQGFAAWLAARGHTVMLVCGRASAPPPPGVEVVVAPASNRTSLLRQAEGLTRTINTLDLDVIHDTGVLLKADIFHPMAGSALHNARRQYLAWPADRRRQERSHARYWRETLARARLEWSQLRRARRVVACSHGVAADFSQFRRVPDAIVSNAIDLPPVASAQERALDRSTLGITDQVVLLATAHNPSLKGTDTLLRALASLEPELRNRFLAILAGHDRDNYLRSLVDQHGLSSIVRLPGSVKDIGPLYRAADVFVHPTWHDAGSLSTLKALAAGAAVITTRADGSSDHITHGTNGFVLAKPGDASPLATLLVELLDSSLRDRIRLATLDVRTAVSYEHNFTRLEDLMLRWFQDDD